MKLDIPFRLNYEKKNMAGLIIWSLLYSWLEVDPFASAYFCFMIVIASNPVMIGMLMSIKINEIGCWGPDFDLSYKLLASTRSMWFTASLPFENTWSLSERPRSLK